MLSCQSVHLQSSEARSAKPKNSLWVQCTHFPPQTSSALWRRLSFVDHLPHASLSALQDLKLWAPARHCAQRDGAKYRKVAAMRALYIHVCMETGSRVKSKLLESICTKVTRVYDISASLKTVALRGPSEVHVTEGGLLSRFSSIFYLGLFLLMGFPWQRLKQQVGGVVCLSSLWHQTDTRAEKTIRNWGFRAVSSLSF